MDELPFMATENIMMNSVKKGGDRQELHEKIRTHSMEAGKQVKLHGNKNDIVERIASDKSFGLTIEEIERELKPENYVGRAPQQVVEFVEEYVEPVLKGADFLNEEATINV